MQPASFPSAQELLALDAELPEESIWQSLAIQARVVWALVGREILTRFGRHNLGFMWLFMEPLLFTMGIVLLWSMTSAAHGSRLPIAAFAITGYSSVLLWRNAASRCAHAIEPNRGLLFHRNVRVIDLYLARLVLELAGATLSLFATVGGGVLLGLLEPPRDPLLMAAGWLLLAWFACGLALVVGSISEMSHLFERLWHTVTYLIFPLSGAAFLVDWLPESAQQLALLVPMVHGTEMLRAGYYGPLITAHYSAWYLAISSLVLTLFGVCLVRKLSMKVEGQ